MPTACACWAGRTRFRELMLSHHLVIGKAGGATVQEAIAARCPMIVNQVIPGQEEGNAELISRGGLGAVAERNREVAELVENAFADKAPPVERMAEKSQARQQAGRGGAHRRTGSGECEHDASGAQGGQTV